MGFKEAFCYEFILFLQDWEMVCRINNMKEICELSLILNLKEAYCGKQ